MTKKLLFFSLGFIICLLLFAFYSNISSKSHIEKIQIEKETKLADCDGNQFSISPEGDKVAYLWKQNLWVVDIYGNKRQLTNVKIEIYEKSRVYEDIWSFSWSPTENKILCEVGIKGSPPSSWRGSFPDYSTIWILNAITGDKYRLIGGGAYWLSDGKKIAYINNENIWIGEEADNSFRGRMMTEIKEGSFLSWSPDERKIIFLMDKNIWILDLQTKEKKQITYGNDYVDRFQWLPGGDKIIYPSKRGGVWEIKVDGSDLSPFFGKYCDITFSRDGKMGLKSVFNVSWNGGYENRLIVLDMEKKKVINSILINKPSVPGIPSFDKPPLWLDERTALVPTKIGEKSGLYAIDIEKGKVKLLKEELYNYAISPNRKKIFFTIDSELWMAYIKKGE